MLQHKHLKTTVNENNKRTGSNAITQNENTNAFEENGNEITTTEMINITVAPKKESSQALRT